MKPTASFLLTILILTTTSAVASDFTTLVLIPLPTGETVGAHGARWSTTLSVHNLGSTPARRQYLCPGQGSTLVPPVPILPKATFVEPQVPHKASSLCFVEEPPSSVAFSLRVRLLEASDFEVGVPVVFIEDFFSGTAALVDVPIETSSRVTLRIYESADHGSSFRLRGFDREGNDILDEIVSSDRATGGGQPGYTEIRDLAARFPHLREHSIATLHVAPLVSGVRFWTFASVTDNETNRFFIITPGNGGE
jgi:hypothetical protein